MTRAGKLTSGYNAFLGEIKERIRSAQYEALKAVNKGLIALYWDIGRMVVERQKEKGWGKSVVERLASDLQKDFPGVQGFSAQNLWYMRQLFLEYPDKPKLQPLVGEINWTKKVLIHHMENQSYDSLDHVNETGTLFCSLLRLCALHPATNSLPFNFRTRPGLQTAEIGFGAAWPQTRFSLSAGYPKRARFATRKKLFRPTPYFIKDGM